MKLLSFDAGIKNLAYCVIDQTGEDFKIDDWGIINLGNDNNVKCQLMDKKGCVCNKCASYTYLENGNIIYSCKTHLKQFVEPQINMEKCQKDSKHTCCYINKNNKICGKKSTYYHEGLDKNQDKYFCTAHKNSFISGETKKCLPKKIGKQNANKIPIQDLSVKLFESLDIHKNFLEVDEVVIENQPTFINPTMKTISAFIYSYFSVRGLVDGNRKNIKSVRFFSPSNKLKINKEHTEKTLKDTNDTDCYTITKELGEKYCRAIISDERKKFLDTYDKKDDLCDSFLQGFMYLFYKDKKIPDKYAKVLNTIMKPDVAKPKIVKPKKTVTSKKKSGKNLVEPAALEDNNIIDNIDNTDNIKKDGQNVTHEEEIIIVEDNNNLNIRLGGKRRTKKSSNNSPKIKSVIKTIII